MKPTQRSLIDGLMSGGLDAVSYSYKDRKATLYVPEFCCTDMSGAIAYAVHHFPDVRTIQTVSGDKPDVVYRRRGAEWEAT